MSGVCVVLFFSATDTVDSFTQGHGTIYPSEHTKTKAYARMVDDLTPFVNKLHLWIDDRRVAPWTSAVMAKVRSNIFHIVFVLMHSIVLDVCVNVTLTRTALAFQQNCWLSRTVDLWKVHLP